MFGAVRAKAVAGQLWQTFRQRHCLGGPTKQPQQPDQPVKVIFVVLQPRGCFKMPERIMPADFLFGDFTAAECSAGNRLNCWLTTCHSLRKQQVYRAKIAQLCLSCASLTLSAKKGIVVTF